MGKNTAMPFLLSVFFAVMLMGFQHSAQAADASNAGNLAADSLLAQGNRHYLNREYDLAAKSYMKIVESGIISGEVYYNLANAYYKLDMSGPAILYYEKALLLLPHDKDIQMNLAIANTRIVDKISVIPQFFIKRWIKNFQGIFTPNQWAVFNLFIFCLMLIAFALYLVGKSYQLRKSGFISGILLLFISIAGIYCMLSRLNSIEHNRSAVIMTSPVNAKSSPDAQSTNVFILHEGTKVTLLDSIQNWREIRITDGNQGWVPGEVLKKI
jgi:tetratricopeptide (TPR) repeat protein